MSLGGKRLLKFVKIVVSIALVLVAIYGAGLFDPDTRIAAWETIRSASLPLLLLSVAWIPVMDIVSTIKWKALSDARGLRVNYWRLLAFYIIGRFYNLVLPSSIGGDVIRISLQGRETGRTADAAAVVFVERLTGVLVLLVLSATAVLFVDFGLSRSTLMIGNALVLLALVVLVWLLVGTRPIAWLRRIAASRVGFITRIVEKLEKVQGAIRAFRHHRGAIGIALLNSLLFYFFAIVNVYITVLVFQDSVSFIDMMIAVPIIMFILNLPVSLGTLGILEFSYTLVLMQFGVSGEAAFATALLVRLKLLLAGLIGAIVYSQLDIAKPDVAAVR